MDHERFSRVIKRPVKTMNNFRNPSFTISRRCQYAALLSNLAGFQHKNFEYGSEREIDRTVDFLNILCADRDSIDGPNDESIEEDIIAYTWVKIDGVEYRPGMVIILGTDSKSNIMFGKIECIFTHCSSDEPQFAVCLYQTFYFDGHLFSYRVEIKVPVERKVIKAADIVDFHPLDVVTRDGLHFIRLRHCV